jgi:hypothetical protein
LPPATTGQLILRTRFCQRCPRGSPLSLSLIQHPFKA